jgi:hypothetical protein
MSKALSRIGRLAVIGRRYATEHAQGQRDRNRPVANLSENPSLRSTDKQLAARQTIADDTPALSPHARTGGAHRPPK